MASAHEASRVEAFEDDEAYLAWVERHPDGYVVNSTRPPTPSYLVLHRAGCRHVARVRGDDRSWTREMGKWCSTDRAALDTWAESAGGSLQPCGHCKP